MKKKLLGYFLTLCIITGTIHPAIFLPVYATMPVESGETVTDHREKPVSPSLFTEKTEEEILAEKDTFREYLIVSTETEETEFTGRLSSSGTTDTLSWTVSTDGVLTISGNGDMPDYESEQAPWYGQRETITSVVIEPGVTSVGANAFYACTAIECVSLPEGLTRIGDFAFYYCAALKTLELPQSTTHLGRVVFGYCFSLESVVLSDDTLEYGDWLFTYCSNLKTVNIPSQVTYIHAKTFHGCTSLETIEIPDNIIMIYIGAFENCSGLNSITLPDDVRYIYENAFSGCNALTQIKLPEGLLSIGEYAFAYCYLLEDIIIPQDVTSIAETAFYYCESLTSIQVSESNSSYTSIDGVLLDKAEETLVCYPIAKPDELYVIPETVSTLGAYAFSGCSNLKELTISDGVSSLTEEMLYGCLRLEVIRISAGVETISAGVFYECPALSAVEVRTANPNYSSANGVLYNKAKTCLIFYPPNKKDEEYYVIKGVTELSESAFYGNCYLKKVFLPEGVVTIGGGAFMYCENLEYIEIPKSVSQIFDYAFWDCSNIVQIIYSGSEEDWSTIEIGELNDGLSKDKIQYNATLTQPKVEGIASGRCGEYATWTLDTEGTLTVVGTGILDTSYDKELWKEYRESVKTAVISPGITHISDGAFRDCSNMTAVSIPEGVHTIGDSAFSNCENLSDINLPNSLTSLGEHVFQDCSSLTKITIPSGVKKIAENAFYLCQNLTEVSLPESIESIDARAFTYCYNLAEINIPEGVTFIGERAFYNCYNLTKIEIPGSVTKIEDNAFYQCSGIRELTLSEGLQEIGEYAFSKCINIERVQIPNSVTSLGPGVFSGCEKLSSYKLSESMDEISSWLFNGTAITEAVIPEHIKIIRESAFGRCNGLTEVIIPDNVEIIEESAFMYCEGITKVTIADSVTDIGDYAFLNCIKLESIKLPNTITRISAHCFQGCEDLPSITIPDSVTSIEDYAFTNCHNLTSVFTAKEGIVYIGKLAFSHCEKMVDFEMPQSVRMLGAYAFRECASLTSIKIPQGVISIPEYAFEKCAGLESIIIPDSVTSIEQYAFYECNKAKELRIPQTLKSIGSHAFSEGYGDAVAVENTIILKNIEYIGDYAFDSRTVTEAVLNCETVSHHAFVDSGLKKITLGKKVKHIDIGAFSGCDLADLTLPNSLQSIGQNAFYGCNFTTLVIPNSVKSIGSYAFTNCSNLTLLTLPNSITVINDSTFSGCTGLRTLTIPYGVTHIGEWSFSSGGIDAYCYLTELYLPKSIQYIGRGGIGNKSDGASLAVYYAGTELEWDSIEIGTNNNALLKNVELHAEELSEEYFERIQIINPDGSTREVKVIAYEYGTLEPIPYTTFQYTYPYLTAEKNGYYTAVISQDSLAFEKTTKIALVPKSTESNVSAVHCRMTDALIKEVTVSSKDEELKIFVYSSLPSSEIAEYQLIQDVAVIASDPTGHFVLRPEAMLADKPLWVKIVKTDGTKCEKLKTNITVSRFAAVVDSGVELSLDKLSFNIPSDVPLIGGGTLSFDVPESLMHVKATGNTLRIGIGCKEDIFKDEGLDDWKAFKKLVLEGPSALKRDASKLLTKDLGKVAMGSQGSLDMQFFGYVEIKLSETGEISQVSGNSRIVISGKYEHQWQTYVVVVPVVVKFKAEAEVDGVFSLGFDFDKSEVFVDGEVDITLPKLTLSAGIGIAYVADISLYGSAANKIKLSTVTDTIIVSLEGTFGISAKVLFMTYEKELLEGSLVYLHSGAEKTSQLSEPQKLSAALQNEESYTIDRDYDYENQQWTGNVNDSNIEIASNVYYSADPKLVVTENGTKMMVWTADIKTRSTGNHTAIVYSVYNEATNTWQEPAIIEDDGTADFYHDVVTCGNDIYVIWMDCKKSGFTQRSTLTEILKSCEITVAKYSAEDGTFLIHQLTDNDTADFMPKITSVNGDLYAAWIHNPSNDIFNNNKDSEIRYTKTTNGNWETGKTFINSQNQVLDLSLGNLSNNPVIAYPLDTDGDVQTSEDLELYAGIIGQGANQITSNTVLEQNPHFAVLDGTPNLVWYSEGNICYTSDLASIQTLDGTDANIGADSTLMNHNNATVLLSVLSNENGSEVYRHHVQDGKIGKPVAISPVGGYVTDYSAVSDGSDIAIAYTRTEASLSENSVTENSSLYLLSTHENSNITLKDVVAYENQMGTDPNVPMEITIKNNGTKPASRFKVIAEKNGTVVTETTIDANLPAGETETYTFELPVDSEDTGNSDYTFRIETTDGTDANTNDNSTTVSVGYVDLRLSVERLISGDSMKYSVVADNLSGITTNTRVNIRANDAQGEILKSFYIQELEGNSIHATSIDAKEMADLLDGQSALYFELVAEKEEKYLSDNSYTLYKDSSRLTSVTVTMLGLSETVVLKNTNYDGIILVGFYDSKNRLISIDSYSPSSELMVDVPESGEYSYAKIMWWDSTAGMKPLIHSVKVFS